MKEDYTMSFPHLNHLSGAVLSLALCGSLLSCGVSGVDPVQKVQERWKLCGGEQNAIQPGLTPFKAEERPSSDYQDSLSGRDVKDEGQLYVYVPNQWMYGVDLILTDSGSDDWFIEPINQDGYQQWPQQCVGLDSSINEN